MEIPYFPLFVNLKGKKIRVAGGGSVALRRIRTLLRFDADIYVSATRINEELQRLEKEGKIHVQKRAFKLEDLDDVQMVIAATNDREVNARIHDLCRERDIPVNVADDHTKCDFYFPSVVLTDDVVVGISSGGEDPGKTKAVRKQLEQILTHPGQAPAE